MVASLATARVFVPIVAQLAEEGEGATPDAHGDTLHGDKQADMALVTLKAPDGRTAMPVFTSAAALACLAPGSPAGGRLRRPGGAVRRGRRCRTAGPGPRLGVTFVVRRPAVWALAQQRDWLPSYADPELARAMGEAAAGFPAVRRVELHPGGGVASADRRREACFPAAARARSSGWCCTSKTDSTLPVSSQSWPDCNTAWSRNAVFAERVDSIEVKLQRAAQ